MIIFIICVLIYIAIAIIGGVVSAANAKKDTEENYQQVIEEIIEGNYSWALQLLDGLKEQDYKDSEYLYYYMQSLNTNTPAFAKQYLDKIPDDYSGIFADDIALEKINYEERCKKELRILDQQKQAEKEKEEKLKKEISKKIPYVGMDIQYINDTIAGKYDEYKFRESPSGGWDEYLWYSDDYKEMLVLSVWAEDGVVFRVEKHGQPDYWIDNKYPNFKGSGTTYSSGNIYSDKEKYDTSRFDHAEDFYDFYYYDFRDFDEAEKYYENHKK